ncbi:phosphoribosyl pyrophosphokinase [Hortaea werneckii]|nr:phosphoribosyl pyrophosphokinase [Hortaea werneckii]
MISACKSASAKSVTAVMPYFPYSRQSKRKTHRGAITARMLANLLNVAGVNHVITIDLHASQMQGFFKCPVDNLLAEPLLAKWLRVNIPEWWDAVVVSKNPGGTKRVTSLADALKLSFGIVTTDRRRPHQQASQNASMYNSAVFESMGPDGSHDRSGLEKEMEDAEGAKAASENRHNATIEQDFARQNATPRPHADLTENRPRRPSGARAATAAGIAPTVRTRLGNSNNETPSSPLARSTRLDSIGTEDAVVPDNSEELGLHRFQTAPGIEQPPVDEDGYEEPGGDDESDERVRDVITGRLIHGHIVDDEISSPNMSARSGSNEYGDTRGKRGSGSSEDEPLPEAMAQSFMSTASTRSRLNQPQHALGGTGDAAASDEEEEEALKDPDVESTVTLVGNVRDKPVLIVDDMIDKAGSWIAAAETVVKRGGATKVYCLATHGLFGGDSLRELEECDQIEAIVVTDAFPIPAEKRRESKKLVVLDVSGLLSEAIRRNQHGESISQLYTHFD